MACLFMSIRAFPKPADKYSRDISYELISSHKLNDEELCYVSYVNKDYNKKIYSIIYGQFIENEQKKSCNIYLGSRFANLGHHSGTSNGDSTIPYERPSDSKHNRIRECSRSHK